MFTYCGAYFEAMTSSDCMQDRICGVCGNVNGDTTDEVEKRADTIVDNTDAGRWRVWDDVLVILQIIQIVNQHQHQPKPPDDCIPAGNEYCAQWYEKYMGSK